MGNRWHETQVDNMQPDVKAKPCPWCKSTSIVVDTFRFDFEGAAVWKAHASCHECGSKSPDSNFPSWEGKSSPLYEDYLFTDSEIEREVVNLAIKVWNAR